MRRFRGFVAEWGWEEIVPTSGTEPSMNRGNALFTKDGNDFVLIGGRQENFSGDSYLSDVWTYSTTSNTWTQVISSGLTNGSNDYVSEYFLGYADSGNVYRGPTSAGVEYFKIAKSTGAETLLNTVSHAAEEFSCADTSGGKIYTVATVGQRPCNRLHSFTLTSSSASSASLTTATQSTRNARSSLAYYPSNNTLYLFAPVISATFPNNETWTLGTGDILKYDLTAATGWTAETGVTNNAGAVNMGADDKGQLVWVDAESKFFLFAGNGQVISYDPASKVLAQVLYDNSPSSYVVNNFRSIRKGNAGDVVVDGSNIYMIRNLDEYSLRNNPARIWKFRRN